MAEHPRLDELKRRVQQDPASIAFAALAEEYRKAGRFSEAVDVCRGGLQRHPAYLSARVTLGRALLEMGKYEEGREHLEHVLKMAPENLAAIRALAEIHRRRSEFGGSDESQVESPAEMEPAGLSGVPPGADTPPARAAVEAPPPKVPVASVPHAIAAIEMPVVIHEEDGRLVRLDQFLGAIARARQALVMDALRPDSLIR